MGSVKNWQWKPKTMYLRICQLLFEIMRTKRTSCQFAFCRPPTRASLVTEMVKNLPAMQETGSTPGSERCPGEGNGNTFQYSCRENSMDRRA